MSPISDAGDRSSVSCRPERLTADVRRRPLAAAARKRDQAPRRRQASSPSHATVRPAVATARMSASESGSSSARATWSCSWRSSLFCSRPARRWSSTRMVGEYPAGVVDGHGVDVVGQDRDRLHHGGERGDVPQAPVGLLQVGFEQEPDVAEGAVSLDDLVGQNPEPRWLLLRPSLAGPLRAPARPPWDRRRRPGRPAGRAPPGGRSRPCRGPRSGVGRCDRARSPRPTPGTRSGRRWPRCPACPDAGARRRGR